MIDETVLAYETEMNALLGPMGIKTEVSERDSCYYMTMDGSKLYNTADEWEKKIGRNFEEFVKVFIPKMYMSMESVTLNETRVEFRIGTIFDMMLRIKEYGKD